MRGASTLPARDEEHGAEAPAPGLLPHPGLDHCTDEPCEICGRSLHENVRAQLIQARLRLERFGLAGGLPVLTRRRGAPGAGPRTP